VLLQVGEKFSGDLTRKHRGEVLEFAALLHTGGPELAFDAPALDNRNLQNITGVELRPELGIGELDSSLLLPSHQLDKKSRHEYEQQPESPGPGDTGHLGAVVRRSKRILFSHIWITPQAVSEFSPTLPRRPPWS